MTKAKGYLAKMQVSTTPGGAGADYAQIDLLNTVGGPETQKNADTTVFTGTLLTYKSRVPTSMAAAYSGSGFSDYSNSVTQRAIWNNIETDAETWLKFYPDGTNYMKSMAEVTKITYSVKVGGFNGFSFEATATGAISHGT